MKIFIVSEAGKIADVTLHTSCKSADESALKVPMSAMRKRLYIQPWLKERRGSNALPANSIVSCCVARLRTIAQVSSSCTSVYIDGSETRGALNAEVKIKYGTFSGQVHRLLTCTFYCCVHVGKYCANVNHTSTKGKLRFYSKTKIFLTDMKKPCPPTKFIGILCNLDARESPYPPPS